MKKINLIILILFLFVDNSFAQTVESFTAEGTTTWEAPTGVTSIAVLVVGGGGSGGNYFTTNANGGGGGGGVIYNTSYTVIPGNSYTVTVGSGGVQIGDLVSAVGNNGQNSVFGSLVALGGGGGGSTGSGPGQDGGSGGGAAYYNQTPGASTQTGGFGNAGGAAAATWTGAGGGGAGSSGVSGLSGNSAPSGNGGQGYSSSITGAAVKYAGGGGGGGNSSERAGDGYDGGGRGAGTTTYYPYNVYTVEVNATTGGSGTPDAISNTGGGGGGGSYWASNAGWSNGSGAGGSGVVIISYSISNTPPTFTSTAITAIEAGNTYAYTITTDDADGDAVTVTAPTKPGWLSLVTGSGGDVTTLAGSGSSGNTDATGASANFNGPWGVAVDASGNVYVADTYNHKIRKITPNGDVTTLAGSGSIGSADANGASASFNYPSGVIVDASGNVYVADRENHKIRKIAPNGDVTTLAGSGSIGSTDATGASASFNYPSGVTLDASGNVYVADQQNHKIRKIAPNGDVTTLAGSGSAGSTDANGMSASFNVPFGVSVDGSGNVYVADFNNNKIRKIAPNNDVSTLAGSGSAGSTDANGASASFNAPIGVAVDAAGNVFVGDRNNQKIRKIDPNGDVTTLAGSGSAGSTDAIGTSASFNNPYGISVDASGNVYVADASNHKIRKISGASVQLTGNTSGNAGSHPVILEANDGNGGITQQSFTVVVSNTPPTFTSTPITAIEAGNTYSYAVTTEDFNGDNVTVTATTKPGWFNLITDAGDDVTTLAGSGSQGSTDANGASASFNTPYGVAVDASGNVYVADRNNHKIRKLAPNGDVMTLAGSGSTGSTDANGASASFNFPQRVAVDVSGNVYVADAFNHKIRKIAPNGDVTTLAGSGSQGSSDANGASASFNFPAGVAVDASGNVYVSDQSNQIIRMIAPNGDVTTLAGSGSQGSTDANGMSASFSGPEGVAVDASGNVYVADVGNHKIRKIAPNGDVTTLAGSGSQGSTDANGVSASFYFPPGVAVDASGNVYVADVDNHKIRKIAPNGDVTTLAGSGSTGNMDANGASASFNYPTGVAVDVSGNIFVADPGNNKIRKISGAFIQLAGNTTGNAGSHDVVLEANDGNGGITLQSFTVVVSNTPPTFTSTPITAIDAGNTYAYTITTDDANGDNITVTAPTKPGWLSLVTDYNVTTLAGSGSQGSTDANGTSASFDFPTGVAVDALGNVYVGDANNNKIRKIATNGDVTTLAGTGSPGSVDANGTSASFTSPYGVAVDASGNVYVAGVFNNKIRKIAPNGDVTTLAGSGSPGSTDANGTSASFNGPRGVAVDAAGNVYVADRSNHKIRKIAPNGDVTTLAGSGSVGSTDANGANASFNEPNGIAADALGNVYVADYLNSKIRKISPTGDVTTLAGSGSFGSTDGNGTSASFGQPMGVDVDAFGNVYVADFNNRKIRKIDSNGDVTTLAGTGSSGSTDGDGAISSFNRPIRVAVDGTGNLYVTDLDNHKVRKISAASVQLTGNSTGNAGSHSVVLEANDGNGGVTQQPFTIVVSDVPAVMTSAATVVTAISATLNGEVTSDGEATITERGFVYSLTSTDATPTLSESSGSNVTKVVVTGTTGIFSDALASLTAATGYSFAAYATNSLGTTEGSVLTLTTSALTIPTIAFMDINKIYGDTDFTLGATSNSSGTISYSIEGAANGTSVSGANNEDVTLGDAGTITIRATQAADGIYSSTTKDITLTIATKDITVTADASQAKDFGAADPTFTYLLTTGALEAGDSFTGSLSRAAGEDVGTYAITVGTLSAGANYNMTFFGVDFSITTKAITVTADASQTKEFGATDPTFTYLITTGSLEAGDSFTGSLSRAAGEDVGTYAISVGTLSAGANYNMAFVGADFSIATKAITVTADASQTKEFGAADPTFTYSITTGALESGDSFTGSLSRAAGEDVGTYAITVGTLSAGANYNMTFFGVDFSITTKAITVMADASQTKDFGATDPTFTYTVTAGALETSDTFSGELTRDAGEDVGTYAITVGALSAGANYDVTFVGVDFSITTKAITVTADASQIKEFGATDPTFTYLITTGALEAGDSFTGSLSRAAGEDVGTYAITVGTLSAGTNYDVTFVGVDFNITTKAITVTADASQTKEFGATDPTFTYTVTAGALETGDTFSGELTRDAGEDVGTYAITVGTLSAGVNYDMTFIGTDFSITTPVLTIPTITFVDINKIYGDADFTLGATSNSRGAITYSIEGAANGTSLSGTNNEDVALGDAGTVTIRATQAADGIYSTTTKDITLTIDKADQTISFATLADLIVGVANFDLTATASSSLGVSYTSSDATVATVSGSTVSIIGAGTAIITASQVGDTDYNAAAVVTQTLTVNKKEQTITFNAIADQVLEDGSITLSATASSGLAITYEVVSGQATITHNVVSFTGLGAVIVQASQAGNEEFNAAPVIEQPFEINTITGVDVNNTSKVSIYPNPASNYIKLLGEYSSVKIINTNGVIVYRSSEAKDEIDISHLQTGNYIIIITDENGTSSNKILKK